MSKNNLIPFAVANADNADFRACVLRLYNAVGTYAAARGTYKKALRDSLYDFLWSCGINTDGDKFRGVALLIADGMTATTHRKQLRAAVKSMLDKMHAVTKGVAIDDIVNVISDVASRRRAKGTQTRGYLTEKTANAAALDIAYAILEYAAENDFCGYFQTAREHKKAVDAIEKQRVEMVTIMHRVEGVNADAINAINGYFDAERDAIDAAIII